MYIQSERERMRQSITTDGNINDYSHIVHASMYPWWVSSNGIDVRKHQNEEEERMAHTKHEWNGAGNLSVIFSALYSPGKNTDIRQSYQNLLSEYTHMNGTVSACKTRERKKIISDGFSPISYRESAAISFNWKSNEDVIETLIHKVVSLVYKCFSRQS